MKKQYESVEALVVFFDNNDIVATSGLTTYSTDESFDIGYSEYFRTNE